MRQVAILSIQARIVKFTLSDARLNRLTVPLLNWTYDRACNFRNSLVDDPHPFGHLVTSTLDHTVCLPVFCQSVLGSIRGPDDSGRPNWLGLSP